MVTKSVTIFWSKQNSGYSQTTKIYAERNKILAAIPNLVETVVLRLTTEIRIEWDKISITSAKLAVTMKYISYVYPFISMTALLNMTVICSNLKTMQFVLKLFKAFSY